MGLIETANREWIFYSGMKRLLKQTSSIGPETDFLVPDEFEAVADRYAERVAFRFEGKLTTYAEFESRACRVANWALEQGLKAGDCIALYMGNCPDYLAIWTGLSKIGVISALINHNLEGEALAHCINITEARHVVYGAEQSESVGKAYKLFTQEPKIWCLGGQCDADGDDMEAALQAASDTRPPREHRRALRGNDLCIYVYTSGTTGLPKAARLTHARTRGMMRTFIAPCNITERDRVYITLPLYHATGGVCGIGMALMSGASIILRRKFSASRFWDDATDEGATAIVYIGELCRYLLNQPAHPKERAHRIRTGFGNGLRPEVWQAFLDRFNIPHLAEFYGSTEGNVSFVNFDGKVGAIGRIPGWAEKKFAHIAFIKLDEGNEKPLRGENGFCIRAGVDEPGEALGLIDPDSAAGRFEGYRDRSATEKKILRDVFTTGDQWFRTGDLLRKDEYGYIYFVDRLGDTFRWKGENVSTSEVCEALSGIEGVATANVYGVEVPGTDGRAGMAAITSKGEINFDALATILSERLPVYAIPLFIRMQKEAETTGTFKFRKVELVEEGFDPKKVIDPIWMRHPDTKQYVPLTRDRYETLISGGFRF